MSSKTIGKKKETVKAQKAATNSKASKSPKAPKVAKKSSPSKVKQSATIKQSATKKSKPQSAPSKVVLATKKKAESQSKTLIKISVSKVKISKAQSKPQLAKKAPESPQSKITPKLLATKKPSKKAKVKDGNSEVPTLILKPRNEPKKISELSAFHRKQLQRLEELRDHILDQMQNQEQITRQRAEGSEASAYGMHQADAGSDSYDRDFALSLLSQEQDALYEIEEAIKRIFYGTYGICEMSGKEIPKSRLEAIPYARFTVECQAQIEKENKRRRRWDSNPASFMESPDLVDQDNEGTNEDEEARRDRE